MFASPVGRRLGIAVLATAALLTTALPASATTPERAAVRCPSCGHNLILNPGAEQGKGTTDDSVVPVPHWKQAGGFTAASYSWIGGDLSRTSPGPKARGANYFYGGPAAATSSGTQLLSVSATGIRSGRVTYKLSGWLGGFSGQDDYAYLRVTFERANGSAISSARIGPVTETQRDGVSKLMFRSRTGMVPAGTRLVKVQLVMVRHDGSDNDGLADSLSLVFTAR